MQRSFSYILKIFFIGLCANALFIHKGMAQSNSITQIHFSKDSSTLIGFTYNDTPIFLPSPTPLVQWERMLSQQKQMDIRF